MNIIYIHTHDSGRYLKPYGYDIPTPNLMEFAKDATLFSNAFCVAPTCSPSRAGLLTGKYPHQNGMLGLAHRGFKIQDYNEHLVSILKNSGYETVLSGVQHEAGHWTQDADAAKTIGYDHNITACSNGIPDADMIHWDKNNANNAAEFIKNSNSAQPFFLSFGLFATHRAYPDHIDESIDANYVKTPDSMYQDIENQQDMAKYMTSAKSADDNIKIVLDALKSKGIYKQSLILFTTDHGLANPFMKCNLNDNGIAVALIVRRPGEQGQGNVVRSLVSHIDVLPTILELAEIEKPDDIEGVSFNTLFDSPTQKTREAVYSEINYHTSYEPCRSIRTERFKFIKYFDHTFEKYNLSNIDSSSPKKLLMAKGILDQPKDMEQLYDLIADPTERNNLIDNNHYSDVLDKMRTQLHKWQSETNDPVLKGQVPLPARGIVERKECESPDPIHADQYELNNLN